MTEVTSVMFRRRAIELVAEEAWKRGVNFPCTRMDSSDALGKRVCGDVLAVEDIPQFDRSTRDGYAVRAEDTFGSSPSLPAYFDIIGEVKVDDVPTLRVSSGKAVKIVTGAPMPEGADAVVMLEYTDSIEGDLIEVFKPVGKGENILFKGEDVSVGSVLASKGSILRPSDIGGLMSNGITEVDVYSTKVGIVSTGNEIVPPWEIPASGKIRDINSYTLSSMVEEFGFLPVSYGIVKDDKDVLLSTARKAIDEVDALLFSGGSSAGAMDFVESVVKELPDSKIVVRGISVSPGKPTLVAFSGRKLIFGMPGHPASSMVIFEVFVKEIFSLIISGDLLDRMVVQAVLEKQISSEGGREDFVRGYLREGSVMPLYGKSGMISTMFRSNCLIHVPLENEGYQKGDMVEVWLI
ncbi:MAG: molybdopterin molybdotransferase MoeA [Synergistetes bacterium]|nr:molybdopterin molybdotransferase MoeA [Synergistota bacterium]